MQISEDYFLINLAAIIIPAVILLICSVVISCLLLRRYSIAIKRLYQMNFNGVENERKRIANDIHDQIGFSLTQVRNALHEARALQTNQRAIDELANAQLIIGDLHFSLRSLVENIYPRELLIDDQFVIDYRGEKKKVTTTAGSKKTVTGLKYTKSLEGSEQDILKPISLNFDTKIKLNDSFHILLTDTLNKVVDDYTVQLDSTQQNVLVNSDWNHEEKFKLIIPQKSVSDSLNNILIKTDTLKVSIKPTSAYGTVLIRTTGFQQFKHPVLLLTQDDKIKYSYPITQPIIRIPLILPGEFIVKILEDDNNNGIWDTGIYGKTKQQPEIIRLVGTSIAIKADWENEFNLILKK